MKLSNIKRFWISFILSIPMLIQMFAMPFHWMMPGYNWIALITTTIIMAISALPYWKSAIAAFKKHSANMFSTRIKEYLLVNIIKTKNSKGQKKKIK